MSLTTEGTFSPAAFHALLKVLLGGEQPALAGGKWQISPDGGEDPLWAPHGAELFYRAGDKVMAVPIETKPAFRASTPRMLFEGHYQQSGHDYAVAPAADRFLMIQEAEQTVAPTQIRVVHHWFEEFRRQTAAGKR